jgi:PLP dependent protein
MDTTVLKTNYQRVLDRIEKAALSSGRSPDEVRLVVVTKTHPLEQIQAVVSAGASFLGENYAEEALPKIVGLGIEAGVEWHMIGHVQSRKARLVCENFHYVHSLDRLKLANAFNRCLEQQGKRMPVLLECNVSGEETKEGFPAWDEDRWQELLGPVEEILALPHMDVRGLMTMAPYFPDQELARPYYKKLRRLSQYLSRHFTNAEWGELSMGMSGDFEAAIQEGATWIRIGTAIFGER